LDGRPAQYDAGRILLRHLAEANEVRVTARLPYVTDGDGMTVTVDPADDERYVCAFTGMDIAQKVIPCFDQPDLKTTFELSVTAPEHWTVLANGVTADRESDERGDTWSFEPTPPISSYLFFLAGGPWASVTWDEPYEHARHGTLSFGWHARASQERELRRDAEELRRITNACFRHYTRVFEPPYAFGDYQQVFAPGLNWGAMEFPGCVVFRDEALTQGEPTALERQLLAAVIAHEMAHMWFGDLVTMQWWEDSWLNESFADFMGYDVAAAAAGYDDAWTAAAIISKPTGYRADRRLSTHPVAEDAEKLVDADTAFANFDMITYAKGNAVLRQLGTWLGEEDFLAGVNRHLAAHAFGNATLAEFLNSLDSATERDVRGWAERWLRTTGFDSLEVTRDGDVPVLARSGTRPHRVSVAAYDESMRLLDTLRVDVADDPVRLESFAGRIVVPNAGDETFAVLRPDPQSWAAVTAGLSSVESSLTRALLWWTAIDLAESRETTVGDLVGLVDRHLRPERHPVVFEGVVASVLRLLRSHASPEQVGYLLATIAEVALEVWDSCDPLLRPGASRTWAMTTGDREALAALLARDDVDQGVRWVAVTRLAELGDESLVASEEQRDRSVSGHLSALTAGAVVPTHDAKAAAWKSLMGGELGSHEFNAVAAGFWGWEQATILRPHLERYAPEGLAMASRSGQAMGRVIGNAFPRLPLPESDRRSLHAQVTETLQSEVPTVLARSWKDSLDDLARTWA
jgi:aminopeptidase N